MFDKVSENSGWVQPAECTNTKCPRPATLAGGLRPTLDAGLTALLPGFPWQVAIRVRGGKAKLNFPVEVRRGQRRHEVTRGDYARAILCSAH